MLTRAFEIVAEMEGTARYPASAMLREMAHSVGSRRLIGGQVADLEAKARSTAADEIRFIHSRKTGEMISLALRLGAMTANATPAQLRGLSEFGSALGLAYQVIDDILDITQASDRLGKTAGKDAKSGKATYPAVFGIEAAKKEAGRLTRKALACAEQLGERGFRLKQIAARLLQRES